MVKMNDLTPVLPPRIPVRLVRVRDHCGVQLTQLLLPLSKRQNLEGISLPAAENFTAASSCAASARHAKYLECSSCPVSCVTASWSNRQSRHHAGTHTPQLTWFWVDCRQPGSNQTRLHGLVMASRPAMT